MGALTELRHECGDRAARQRGFNLVFQQTFSTVVLINTALLAQPRAGNACQQEVSSDAFRPLDML